MKHIFTFLLFLALSSLFAQNVGYYIANQVIVQYKDAASYQKAATLRSNLDVRKINAIPALQIELWELPKSCEMGADCLREVKEWADYLKKNENDLAIVQPNYIYGAGRSLSVAETHSLPPNDTAFYKQWYLHNTGWNGGTAGMDIGALAAWDIRKDAKYARVGIFDTGIDWKHPDLVDNIWRNLGEDADHDSTTIVWNGAQWVLDPGDLNGIDDDQNGYVDDVIGWDFVNNDNNPTDDNGHGTHVSGIIGAKQNNTLGISGIAGAGIQMMPLKCLDESGSGYSFSILLALQYSINMGAMVTNHSYGGGAYDPLIFNFINTNCKQAGQLLVAAAGNNHINNDTDPMYPASYDSDIIISVGSHDCSGNPSAFSNFGSQSVDIFAPGDAIYSTDLNGQYAFRSGTSMASPMVTAAVALAWKQFPASTQNSMKSRILNTATNLTNSNDICVSNGVLNLSKAVTYYKDSTFYTNGGAYLLRPAGTGKITFEENGFLWGQSGDCIVKTNIATKEQTIYDHTNSGLPNVRIMDIEKDDQGNKWILTRKNLVKFDGVSWTIFNSNLNLRWQQCLEIDAQGHKWMIAAMFGSSGDVLLEFDGINWIQHPHCSPIDIGFDLAIDFQGNKWVGGDYLIKLNDTSCVYYDTTNSPLVGLVSDIAVDLQGNKWVGGSDGVHKFNDSTWVSYTTANTNVNLSYVQDIGVDSIGNIWVIADMGLGMFDGTNWAVIDPTNYGGNFIHGTNNGLWTSYGARIDGTNIVYVDLGVPQPLSNLNAILIDSQERKWISASPIAHLDSSSWTFHNGINTTHMALGLNGNIWAMDNSHLFKYNGNTWATIALTPQCITVDNQGIVWIAVNNGIGKYDGTNFTLYDSSNSNFPTSASNYPIVIKDIITDTQGNVWFTTKLNSNTPPILVKYDGSSFSTFTITGIPSFYSNWAANCLAIDNQGIIWIGHDGGLIKYDGTSFSLIANTSLRDAERIRIDREGYKWIVKGSSIIRFDGTNAVLYNSVNTSMPDGNITDIAVDNEKNKWLIIENCIYLLLETPVFFTTPTFTTCLSSSLTFTNQTTEADSFTWKVNNTTVSNDSNLTYTFTSAGVHRVELIAHKGTLDKSFFQYITVRTPVQVDLGNDTTVCHSSFEIYTEVAAEKYKWKNLAGALLDADSTNESFTVTGAGAHTVVLEVTDFCGAVDRDTIVVTIGAGTCVLPGDVNADGAVDMADFIVLQPLFGQTGTPRPAASTQPVYQVCPDWSGNQPTPYTSVNKKHGDCDGNGIINLADANVIKQNATGMMKRQSATDSTVYEMYLQKVNPNPYQWYYPGDTIWHYVRLLREDGAPINNVQRFAFNGRYNLNIIEDPAWKLNGSFMGNPSTNLFGKVIRKKKYADVGVIRPIGVGNNVGNSVVGMLGTNPRKQKIDTLSSVHSLFLTITTGNGAVTLNNGTRVKVHTQGSHNTETVEIRLPWNRIDLKVNLQGAYDANAQAMRTDLRQLNLLPTTNPYADIAPFKPVTLPANVVDWVEVQLREANNPTESGIVDQRAALLLADGSVISPYAEDSGHLYLLAKAGNYKIVVKHRNHLAVVTQTPNYLSGNLLQNNSHDFTTQSAGQIEVSAGKYAMYAGDINQDKTLTYTGINNDRELIFNKLASLLDKTKVRNGYFREDTNLDGKVQYSGAGNDRAIILRNVGGNTPNSSVQSLVQ